MTDRSRLRWRCRRGTKELDIMLMRFFDRHFDELSLPERVSFEKVLAAQDPELTDWLFGRSNPPEDALTDIVERIRNTPHI